MKRAKLDRRTSELVSIALQVRQGCELCLEAHENAARSIGVTEDQIDDAKRGTSASPQVAAMIAIPLKVYQEPTGPEARLRSEPGSSVPW